MNTETLAKEQASFAKRVNSLEQSMEQLIKMGDSSLYIEELMHWGKALLALSPAMRQEALPITACQAQTWLLCRFPEGRMLLYGHSEALLVKGIIAAIKKVIDQTPPALLIQLPPRYWQPWPINRLISSQRNIGFQHMMTTIHYFAEQQVATYTTPHSPSAL